MANYRQMAIAERNKLRLELTKAKTELADAKDRIRTLEAETWDLQDQLDNVCMWFWVEAGPKHSLSDFKKIIHKAYVKEKGK